MRGAKRRGAVPAKRRRGGSLFWGCLALLLFVLCGFWAYRLGHPGASLTGAAGEAEIPAYAGEDVIVLGGNLPAFAEEELTRESFVRFSPFDALGRTEASISEALSQNDASIRETLDRVRTARAQFNNLVAAQSKAAPAVIEEED